MDFPTESSFHFAHIHHFLLVSHPYSCYKEALLQAKIQGGAKNAVDLFFGKQTNPRLILKVKTIASLW
jgi:hypothetical protein